MKSQTVLRNTSWLLALCFASALALAGCKSTPEQPTNSDQPQTAQPQKEHPEHPK
jgi:hypothetical protein